MTGKRLEKFYELVKKNAECEITAKDEQHGTIEIYGHHEELGTLYIFFMFDSSDEILANPKSVAFQAQVVTDMRELAFLRISKKRVTTLRKIVERHSDDCSYEQLENMTKDTIIDIILQNKEMYTESVMNDLYR